MRRVRLPPVFADMLLSFVTLADTQNLSRTVELLGISRQSVRRHVRELEEVRSHSLFDPEKKGYQLTPLGMTACEEAHSLINTMEDWLNGIAARPQLAPSIELELRNSGWLYAQQHRLIDLWSLAPPILRWGLRCVTLSEGQIEHPEMTRMRSYAVICRKYREEWVTVETGERSAHASSVGEAIAKSELGQKLNYGSAYDPLVQKLRHAYNHASEIGGAVYDHVSLNMPRRPGGPPIPTVYQRLVAACQFANGDPAVIVFVARTNRVDIPRMPKHRLVPHRSEDLMEFEP